MTNAENMTISAVIPAYNCEKYIARSIDSVLNQTRSVNEIIVVDDGSTDHTADIIKTCGDRVRYLYQPNAGVSAARNAGIKAAVSDWIAFLDADDQWLPEKIEMQIRLIKKCPQLRWTTGNFIKCLEDENRSGIHTPPDQCIQYLQGREYYESYFRAVQLYQWGHTDCMLIQKSIFDEVGVFDPALKIAEDLDLWLRIAYRYPAVGFSPEALAVYNLSTGNSLMKKQRKAVLYADFIERHITIARQEGKLDQFKPAAGFIMRRWIQGMLFDGRKQEIREMITRFPQYFSRKYRCLMYGLTACPGITAGLLRCLSKITRRLKLRREISSPPPDPKSQGYRKGENQCK